VTANVLSIGALAEQSGHQASALRYYEEVGLLKPVARVSGRRRYEPDAVLQLGLIALLQDVGFTLDEIRSLLPHQGSARERWQRLATTKVEELDATIRKAQAAKRLLELTIQCRCTRLDGCELVVAAGERRRVHRASRRRVIPLAR
jgi:MerR family transcriptional regulator, redox-sensitive transcriptional activator SoxR